MDLAKLIDSRPLSMLQVRVLVLAAVTVLLDSFDIQAVAFAVPALSIELGIERARLGPVFSAGLLGMALGSILISPLADRSGRRVCVMASVAVFGRFTLLTARANDFQTLMLLRFAAGLGFGGALPGVVVLVGEYSPARVRALCAGAILVGVPLGGLLGGLFATWAIPVFGWQSIFVADGVLPLILLAVLWRAPPESMQFLAQRGEAGQRPLREILCRLVPDAVIADNADRSVSEQPGTGSGDPRQLFNEGGARNTLLIWAAFFTNLMGIYFLFNWIPTLLVDAGYSIRLATTAAVVFNCGGVIGLIALGWAVNRLRWPLRSVIGIALAVGAVHVAPLGMVAGTLWLMFSVPFVVGLFVMGAQGQLFNLGTSLYTIGLRATGLGWAVGFGRFGSVIAPPVGGYLVLLGLGTAVYFAFFGALLALGALSIAVMSATITQAIREPEVAGPS